MHTPKNQAIKVTNDFKVYAKWVYTDVINLIPQETTDHPIVELNISSRKNKKIIKKLRHAYNQGIEDNIRQSRSY